jgi:hypothetical protein
MNRETTKARPQLPTPRRPNEPTYIDQRSAQSLGNLTSDENYEKIYNSVIALKPGDPLGATVFRESKVLKLTTTSDR